MFAIVAVSFLFIFCISSCFLGEKSKIDQTKFFIIFWWFMLVLISQFQKFFLWQHFAFNDWQLIVLHSGLSENDSAPQEKFLLKPDPICCLFAWGVEASIEKILTFYSCVWLNYMVEMAFYSWFGNL